MDVFARYHEANEIIEALPDGSKKEHLRDSATQLLHLEQGRKVAMAAYAKYTDEMNKWENNILDFIKKEAQKTQFYEGGIILYVKNAESIKHCKKIVVELERVKEAAMDLIEELEKGRKK